MQRNVCGFDRLVRLVAGTMLILVAMRRPSVRDRRQRTISAGQILVGYAGAELLITGLMQWCPMNFLLGIDTCDGSENGILDEGW